MVYSTLFLLPLIASARAANDWKKPCFNGECSWDLPATNPDGTPGGVGTMVVVCIRLYLFCTAC